MVISLDKRKILFSILIITAIFVCLASVYSSSPQEKPDNVIKVEGIEFNTSSDCNITKFKLFNTTEFDDGSFEHQYVDEDFEGYNIFIWNLSVSDDSEWKNFSDHVKEQHVDDSFETINGIVVYNITAGQGEHAGEPRFEVCVINNDFKTIVEFSTPNPNETVKIASSLKFH